jgi:tRNA modification GTPase
MPLPSITLLTPRSRGAVATLRFEGPAEALAAFFTPANGKPLQSQVINRVIFGHWGREIPEEVVLCRTAENVAEIHCHGGEAAAGRILSDLQSLGCQKELWPEMLKRTKGTFQSEWIQSLSKATTARTAGILLRQGEHFPAAVRQLQELARDQSPCIEPIQELLKWAEIGRHLAAPWEIVLGGAPNVGKSSLINALVGFARSIVYDQPGTTRDVVTAETAFEGWPIRFADTAGLRQGAEPLEAEGIERAKRRLWGANCQILLRDVSQPLTETDRELREEFPKALVIAHKCDLAFHPQAELPAEAIRVSSVTGEGVELLAKKLIERLIPVVPPRDQAIPFTTRQIELLEKALQAAQRQDPESIRSILQHLLS